MKPKKEDFFKPIKGSVAPKDVDIEEFLRNLKKSDDWRLVDSFMKEFFV